MPARDLFISHSSGDVEVARALRTILEDAGYSCWMAPDDVVGTETWTEQILEAIADSKAMLILVSARSNQSKHVSREVSLALGKGRPVLPIRIEDVAPGGSLEYLLTLVQRVDAFPPPVGVHRDRILRQIDTIVERPTTTAGAATPTKPVATPTASTPPNDVQVTTTHVVIPGMTIERPKPGERSGTSKVMVGGIAIAALAAVVVLASGMLNGGPDPSAQPTGGAVGSPSTTAPATGTPTEPPMSVSPTARPLNAAELALQALLPVGAADPSTCTSWPTPPGGDDVLSPSGYAGSNARLRCSGPDAGGPPTEFAGYTTTAALDADYDSIMTSQGVAAGGACVTAIPANAPWNFPTYPESGRLACFERNGRVQYVWTQRELRVLGQWSAPDNPTGYAFWQTWSQTFNRPELDLMAALPASVDDVAACVRAADRYYEQALAIVACPRPSGQNAVYYASFTDADVLTSNFSSIMTAGGFPEDTTVGCYDITPTFGRYTWGYKTGETVGPTEGYIGCYERTDTDPPAIQYVWTFNRAGIMGLWGPPDMLAGIEFFDDWIVELR